LPELDDPGVGLVSNHGWKQQIVSAEGRSALPPIAVFVETIVTLNLDPFSVGFFRYLDGPGSSFGDWFLICHDSYLLLKGVCVLPFIRSRRKNQTRRR
jgi:hypothetical protein